MSNELEAIGDSAHIIGDPERGDVVRVRWMRYRHEFPARVFLEGYPDDFSRFLQRAREMATTGTIRLRKHGHPIQAPFNDLHQFNMELTRSWGVRIENVYIVLYAAKKRKGQEDDYRTALARRDDYLNGN